MILHTLQLANQIASDIFADVARSQFGDAERTRTQALVLLHLTEHSGDSQVAITSATGIDRSTLADVVSRLHGQGLIRRRRARKDRRRWVVELTERGVAAALAAKMVIEQAEVELARRIPSVTKLRIPPAEHPAQAA